MRNGRRTFVTAERLAVCLLMGMICWALAAGQVIERVNLSSEGMETNHCSGDPSLSADGRIVAFLSHASNLVSGDTNIAQDAFVRDRLTGETTRVSVSSAGDQADGQSGSVAISAEGRFVVFHSGATNLVAGDTNHCEDVFVHDRRSGLTTRESVSSTGDQADQTSHGASITDGGRCVAFESGAHNLVPSDIWGTLDAFVRDRWRRQTRCVTPPSTPPDVIWISWAPAISGDGHFVAFYAGSDASHPWGGLFVRDRWAKETRRLVTGRRFGERISITPDGRFIAFSSGTRTIVVGDTNGKDDCFVYDQAMKQATRVSVDSLGGEGNGDSRDPCISADGRFVAFSSSASNLVPGDTNGWRDVFVHDRQTGRTVRVNRGANGSQAKQPSADAAISRDGRLVAFWSYAPNLVPGDGNRFTDVFIAANPLIGVPVLTWLGTAGYEWDGVDPDWGTGRQTRFSFRVRYQDADGDAPSYVTLHLRRNGTRFGKFAMARGAGDYMYGRVYRKATHLPPGRYEHCFRARTRDGLAVGAPTEWRAGPIVSPEVPAGLAGVGAVPD
jgi:Tol biopolymer transport system component